MTDAQPIFIDVSQLRIGLYVYLDMSWLAHPFSVNNFIIDDASQIATIRSLGIARIRYAPEKSVPELTEMPGDSLLPANVVPISLDSPLNSKVNPEKSRRELLAAQHASLMLCEKQFNQTAQQFRQIVDQAHAQPTAARDQSHQTINALLSELSDEHDTAIRLLSENAGEKTALHAVNVTVISLLLGRAMHLSKADMFELGVGALLHDIGKLALPDRVRWHDELFTPSERQLYQSHVVQGINLARKMALSNAATLLIAQHHEHTDGSGYPASITEEKIIPVARIAALVNRYDNLCNPTNPVNAMTPHEALSLLFAQYKNQFHTPTLATFIRMMGIYPPGSIVQLNDERYAIVISVNSSRPIKPKIIVYEPSIPKDNALIMNLEQEPQLAIRRSLKPMQLPKAAFDYLTPRKRLSYFFERGSTDQPAEVKI
jgi:putative nucleotidyltransferase with HDIG domain